MWREVFRTGKGKIDKDVVGGLGLFVWSPAQTPNASCGDDRRKKRKKDI